MSTCSFRRKLLKPPLDTNTSACRPIARGAEPYVCLSGALLPVESGNFPCPDDSVRSFERLPAMTFPRTGRLRSAGTRFQDMASSGLAGALQSLNRRGSRAGQLHLSGISRPAGTAHQYVGVDPRPLYRPSNYGLVIGIEEEFIGGCKDDRILILSARLDF